jgi:hypothetical protein
MRVPSRLKVAELTEPVKPWSTANLRPVATSHSELRSAGQDARPTAISGRLTVLVYRDLAINSSPRERFAVVAVHNTEGSKSKDITRRKPKAMSRRGRVAVVAGAAADLEYLDVIHCHKFLTPLSQFRHANCCRYTKPAAAIHTSCRGLNRDFHMGPYKEQGPPLVYSLTMRPVCESAPWAP